jgi:hypothetical protein
MGRTSGILLLAVVLLAMGGLRAYGHWQARQVLASEEAARETLAALAAASTEAVSRGPHPGLTETFLAGHPGLRPLPELTVAQVSYATDGRYLYGLAARTLSDDGGPTHGFVLRAWPLEFGVSGDVEFHVTEDGRLWQSQNVIGRSGTRYGFPPRFPEPEIGQQGSPWWTELKPGQR